MSPSPERFEPICGVNGKPLNSVAMPFNCQPPDQILLRRAERQFVARRDTGLW